MTTDELIRSLRACAIRETYPDCENCAMKRSDYCMDELKDEAADRLEELDERVGIMAEGQQLTF